MFSTNVVVDFYGEDPESSEYAWTLFLCNRITGEHLVTTSSLSGQNHIKGIVDLVCCLAEVTYKIVPDVYDEYKSGVSLCDDIIDIIENMIKEKMCLEDIEREID